MPEPNAVSHGYGDAYTNFHAMHGEMYTYAAAASDARAASDAITVTGMIKAGTREKNSLVPATRFNCLLRKRILG